MDVCESQIGKLLSEGKTKRVFSLKTKSNDKLVYITNKDNISAGDNSRNKRIMKGKGRITVETSSAIFNFLNAVGIKTAFVSKVNNSDNSFIAVDCEMIPIEIVIRRIATGTYLKLNPDVSEGLRFITPEIEIHIKDDANHDPLWSVKTLVEHAFTINGLLIDEKVVEVIQKVSKLIFEILERVWHSIDYQLVDLKVEFGVICDQNNNKKLFLADIIDNETWRLWPKGDKKLMVDKQIYRGYKEGEVDDEVLDYVRSVFQKVSDLTQELFSLEKHNTKSLNKNSIFLLMNSENQLILSDEIVKHLQTYYGINGFEIINVDETDDTFDDLIDSLSQSHCEVIVTIGLKDVKAIVDRNTAIPVVESDCDNTKTCLDVAKILAVNDLFIWSKIKAKQCFDKIENY